MNYYSVIVKDIDIEIVGYQNNTAAKQALILDAITELVNGVRPFIAGVDVLSDKNDFIDTYKIATAINKAVPSSIFSSIILSVDSVDVASYTFENGDIPFMNSISYS